MGRVLAALTDAETIIGANSWRLRFIVQKGATATRRSFRRGRHHIPSGRRRDVMARFEADGRMCAICSKRVAEGEPVDIHHLTSWSLVRRRGDDPDVVDNLGVAHSSCNQGWKISSREHAELRQRFEAYLATLPSQTADKLRRSIRRIFPGYKQAEFLNERGF